MRRCTWDCSHLRITGGEDGVPCRFAYCTDPELADMDAPPCTEAYKFAASDLREIITPYPIGRIALVEWDEPCLREAPTLF